jgi:hypothetical protein
MLLPPSAELLAYCLLRCARLSPAAPVLGASGCASRADDRSMGASRADDRSTGTPASRLYAVEEAGPASRSRGGHRGEQATDHHHFLARGE